MSLSFAELARLNAMDERIKALEAELKRRKGGRPKKEVLSPSEVNASARHVEGLLAGAGN